MKKLYEIGIVFRGFVVVHYIFEKLTKEEMGTIAGQHKDLRGAFVSAISSFAETAFANTSLEYLESGQILFIFKIADAKSVDSPNTEPIILYGLVKKSRKKGTDKLVKRFLEKTEPLLNLFLTRYNGKDFCEINQFEPFKEDISAYFNIENEIKIKS